MCLSERHQREQLADAPCLVVAMDADEALRADLVAVEEDLRATRVLAQHGVRVAEGVEPVRGSAQRGMIDHLALRAADPESYAARLAAAGLAFDRMDVPEIDRHLIFVRDPNGILVELGFPLGD